MSKIKKKAGYRIIALSMCLIVFFNLTSCNKNIKSGGTSSAAVVTNSISNSSENIGSNISMDSSSITKNSKISSSSGINTNVKQNIKTFDKDNNGNISLEPCTAPVNVDFSVRDGMPLFKKYSYFIIGDTPFQNVIRYASYLKELRARNARFSITLETSDDDVGAYNYNLNNCMELFGDAIKQYTTPYWHMSYVRAAIDPNVKKTVSDEKSWVYYEPVYSVWNNAWKTAAEYFRKKKIRCYYEVWNEPDINLWTKFNWDGYIRMYKNTAVSLRKGDPNAFVGGIVSADFIKLLGINNYRKFLNTMQSEKIPVDFVSFHNYFNSYINEIPKIKAELASSSYYNKTQIHYTEFNVYSPPMSEWYLDYSKRKDFTLQKCDKIPEMYKAMEYLNTQTDVSIIQWAALMDGSGAFSIINPNGTRTATYYAHYLYAHMPVERMKATTSNSNVGIMASADTTVASALLWNNTKNEQSTTLNLNKIPFSNYEVTLYRIDSTHSSINENSKSDVMEPLEKFTGCNKSSVSWTGKIPANGTVYVEIRKTGAVPELDQTSSVGKILRNDNYYEDRTKNSYADFDDMTSTALLGMGDNASARSLLAITYSNIKDKVNVTGKLKNTLQKIDSKSCIGVRVDYQTGSGYTKSVIYTTGITGDSRDSIFPWGTMKKPDRIIRVNDITNFQIDIKGNAPSNWNGQVIVSFDMQNTGKWTEAKLKLS